MNVTFRQLRLFLALADSGSVSAAARAMHVTQPTASMRLRQMSDTIGLPLYEVVGKRLSLTEAGRELVSTARTISAAWEAFEQEINAVKGLEGGKLRVAVVSTAKYFMPRLIGAFCKAHPRIDVSLEILNRDGVVDRLRNNQDDLYIMSMPPADVELVDEIVLPNPIVVIAPVGDHIASGKKVRLKDLSNERFILRERGSGTRMATDLHFRKTGFRPNVRLELGSNEAVKESVAGGLGYGIISRHALHGHERENGVHILNVEGFPLPSVWHIVHLASKRLSPIAHVFKQHVLKEMSKENPVRSKYGTGRS